MEKRIPLPRRKIDEAVVWQKYDEKGELIFGGYGKVVGASYYEVGTYNTVGGWVYEINSGYKENATVHENDIMMSI